MAASENLSYEQLAMYMPAHEVMAKTGQKSPDRTFRDYGLGLPPVREGVDAMWGRKTQEAKERGLTRSIKKSGIKKAVKMMPYMGQHVLLDGHHRVAAAHSLDPNYLVPVEHF
jgi:hypothetical protein